MIASQLNYLFGTDFNGNKIGASIDNQSYPGILRWRMWPDGPVTPRQQMRIAQDVAEVSGLSITTSIESYFSIDDVIDLLLEPNITIGVTIIWDSDNKPSITIGDGTVNKLGDSEFPIGAHGMFLVAYDETHRDTDGVVRPFGFVNSWVDGGDDLYWMTYDDFYESWLLASAILGNNTLIISTP